MSQAEPAIHLDVPLATRLAVGKGQFQLLHGSLSWRGNPISSLTVSQPSDRDCFVELFPTASDETEFLIRVPWREGEVGQKVSISLQISSKTQNSANIDLDHTQLISKIEEKTTPVHTIGDEPLVAICMAMYQPDVERFGRQLESIICQTYENWVLIISDDASPDFKYYELSALCNIEPRRIRLIQHDTNLGFYHNFERALTHLPDNTKYVAFADQDDIWYPDKLKKLVAHIEREARELVYSDMRLVDDAGEVIADSYWQGRKNEYEDFDTVFLANTVTGAASLFRRELLAQVLPFPPRIGDAFHDHWLACVALCNGKIGYVDEALYDYVQYDDSVIGHCDFEHESVSKRFSRASSTSNNDRIDLYRKEYLRLQAMADTLKIRNPNLEHNSTLGLTDGSWLSALKLLKTYFKMRILRRTTNHAELSLLAGFMLRKWQLFRR